MSAPLSVRQLNALEHERDGFLSPMRVQEGRQYAGLVRRNLLMYRWGNTNAMGYSLTAKGRAVLEKEGR